MTDHILHDDSDDGRKVNLLAAMLIDGEVCCYCGNVIIGSPSIASAVICKPCWEYQTGERGEE
jgi:hypothetical protein